MKALRILGLALAASALLPFASAMAQQAFPTPEAASAALIDAARHPGQGLFDKIFGTGAGELFSSGDPDVDRQRLQDFLGLAEAGTSVADGQNGEKVLVFGSSGWQFPAPLKQEKDGWTFDLAAGRQEIIDRAVGRNELLAIDACADYVAAQNEYFSTLHDDEPVQQYARRFVSSEGKHDGLYWEPASQTDISPLGDRIAAVDPGEGGKPGTYHGYHFRVLTRQGAAAPGGAYDYLVNGRMLAGFAMVAYPAEWGTSGVMSFFCDQRGDVYEANLGSDTEKLAQKIQSFNPGPDWEAVPTQ